MKITYLHLKNFAAIETGMHRKDIVIDFTKCKNTVILLVGVNGSGKTALLSTLHPFAYPGNMDNRSNSEMILKDKDGEKEIHYMHNGNTYIIKHFYKNNKRGTSVKSFISKNDRELNPNGNVTSFNELVYSELGIQQDYLKLLRLGNNVTNLIEMKASERKSFSSDLFSELDMWDKLYKKVNEDSRLLKNLLSTVASKLQRLHVSDRDSLIDEITAIESDIQRTNANMDDLKKRIGSIEGKIQALIPEGSQALKSNIESMSKTFATMVSNIEILNKKVKDFNIIICGDIDDDIDRLENDINILEIDIEKISTEISTQRSVLNDLMNDRDDITRQLESLSGDEDINALKELRSNLLDDINETPKHIKDYKPIASKEVLLTAINLLIEIDRIASVLYEFGMDAVKKCITLIREGVDVEKFVGDEVAKIDKKIINVTAKYKADKLNGACVVLFRPAGCNDDTCPYFDLYERFFKPKSDETESVSSLEDSREYYIKVSAVAKNLKYISMLINSNKVVADKLNALEIPYMSMSHIVDSIFTNSPIYVESKIIKHINDIEDHASYMKKIEDLASVDYELLSTTSNESLIKDLKSRLVAIETKIASVEILIRDLINHQANNSKRIDMLKNTMQDYLEYRDLINTLNGAIEEADKYGEELKRKTDILDTIKSDIFYLEMVDNQMQTYSIKLQDLQKQLFDKRYVLTSYDELIMERHALNDKFEDVAITREALSSTKGAPLIYIQLYLQSTTLFVNNILSSIYDNFEIEGFEITESEFNIPYIKNGVRINDVSHASQGERSFLSLALSFALINKSIQDYNIMLLDEIDATLDTRNRSMFLSILLDMIDLIDSEQVFMITHNNMFDSQPVDIIMTSDVNLDSYDNANIIFKA